MMQEQSKIFNNFNIDFNDESDDSFSIFFSNTDKSLDIDEEAYDYKEQTKSTYIVNGEEMSEEEYKKMDKSTINLSSI